MLRWARERAGLPVGSLERQFPKLEYRERGEARLTVKQLEELAKATHTPVGYLFLPEPPIERVPIPNFRTIEDALVAHPSPDLREPVKNQQLG
jgi:hypothetical protein